MRRLIWLTLLSIVLCQLPAGAKQVNSSSDVGAAAAYSKDEPPQTQDNPALSEEASKILTRMTDFISAAPAFYMVAYGGNEELQQDGQLLESGAQLELAIQRPSQANLRVDSRDGTGATIILDGNAISVFSVIENIFYYDTTHQPGDINESLDFLAAQLGVPRPLRYFLSKDLTASLSRVQTGYYVGESTIAGVLCDHLALRNEMLDVQLWIEKGSEPVPRRMLILHKDIKGRPRAWLQFSEWDFSPKLSERTFTLSPPRNAERFRFFEDTFAEESE